MSSQEFKEKVESLEKEIEKLEKKVWFKDMCSVGVIASVVAVPIVVIIFLYFTKFRIIQNKDDDDNYDGTINKGKFLKWTILLTIVLWIALYFAIGALKCRGYLK